VIAASSVGTIFEWYDFFIYGTLAPIIGRLFFPAGNETAQFLLALASFGVGFGVRPIGAALFGYLGDRLGRKYTFLVTVAVMGLATAGVGLVPSYAQIGIAAPAILIALRVAQGLALGGEYGGATIYVAEHAPRNKRGFYTSFIQASVIGGFLLSLIVVLSSQASVTREAWDAWGWRIPFLFSLLLLVVSLWMRLRLHESPVFQAMKAAGRVSGNPLKESFSSLANFKLIIVTMLGIAAGLTVIWYTAQFGALYVLQNAQRLDDMWTRILIGGESRHGGGGAARAGDRLRPALRLQPLRLGHAARRVRPDPRSSGEQGRDLHQDAHPRHRAGGRRQAGGGPVSGWHRQGADRRRLVGREGEAHDRRRGGDRAGGGRARHVVGHDIRAGGGPAGGTVPGAHPL
jgi:MFS family permease